ncbi:uncharacterized protein LOC129951892 [Eupeodes corollae]|uniref:uncharacterized protein LOC129951892 n=1 Tax=Eupeodes corollae TaxID=290404 RepID=UPI0024916B10|nr:uncharacterized protein LOC129951892 [Eupeodes corollae]
MKFLCSILILAGFFALNDASLTYEEEMRIVNDQLLLEELKLMTENRGATSIECSQTLLTKLTDILATYNNELNFCNQTKEDTIADLNKIAKKLVKSYGKTMESSCSALSTCGSLSTPTESFACFEEQGSDEAKTLTSVSNDASTKKSELEKDIENAVSTEDVCKTLAYALYSDQSTEANAEFTRCVNNKDGESEQKPTSTAAPAEESEEKDERPSFRANKFMRF